MIDKPKHPLSIEQAGNYLKEKNKTLEEDTKKKAREAPISVALPEQMKRYLSYGISLMEDVSESDKNIFCAICHLAPALYTTRDVAERLKKFLLLTIHGVALEDISYYLKMPVVVAKKVQKLAVDCVKKAIEKTKNSHIPILGNK